MDNVIALNTRKNFEIGEAQKVLPVVFRITKTYSEQVQVLINRLDNLQGRNDEMASAIEEQINNLVQEWQTKMEKLGAQTKGLWIADFDSGNGYFCWKYPETEIKYWHRYSDGFSGRQPIKSIDDSPVTSL